MPDVRMPDGTIIRNVPAGTTKAQLAARLAKHKPAAKPRADSFGDWRGNIGKFVSTGNALLVGAVEGAYNAASAVTDPIASAAMNLASPGSGDRAVSGANQGRRSVVNAAETLTPGAAPGARTVGRVAGAMAVPLPGKKLQEGGRLAKTAYRMIQGAVGGAGVREVDENALAPAATGAVTNALLGPVVSAVVKPIGRAVSARLGRPQASSAPPSLGRKAAAREARFKSLGVDNPTTGMVTRDPAAFSFEQNTAKLAGPGEDLARQLREVETTLVEKGRALVRGMGGAKGAEAAGKSVEDALDAKRSEMQAVTGRLYDKVRETRGDDAVGDLAGFRTFLDDPMVVDNAVFDTMRDSITRRLARFGDAPPTISQVEELRKFIGGLGSGIEPSVRMMRGKMIDALDDDVVNAVGDDAFKAARASARARFEEFGKTFPGKLADEKLAPEVLTKRVLGDGVKLSDLRALRSSLTTGTPDQIARGQQAVRDLQAQAVEELLTDSIDADGNLIGSALSRKFSKAAPKLRELLGAEHFRTLRRLAAATRDVKAYPAGHSVNTSNTASTLANMFDNAPPKIKGGWTGLFGKLGLRAGAHAAAATVAGPAGNLAVEGFRAGATAAAAGRAEQAAATALMDKIRLAQSPAAAAAAVREAQAAAGSSPVIAELLNGAGFGRIVGGTAASQ